MLPNGGSDSPDLSLSMTVASRELWDFRAATEERERHVMRTVRTWASKGHRTCTQTLVFFVQHMTLLHSGIGSVAAVVAMAATLFWPKKTQKQSLLNVYDSGNRAYINKLWIILQAL